MTEENKMTFMGHLRDLRSCLVRSVIALAIAVPIAFLLVNYVFEILTRPVPGLELIYTEITEMLGTYLKVNLYLAVAIALPYIIFEVVRFLHPALTGKERGYVYVMLPAVVICFLGGVVFAYFILIPPAFNFLLTFGGDIAKPMIKVGNYVGILSQLLFWIGICFEIPIVLFFLSKIGIINYRWLAKVRKVAYILAFVLGAVITPTFDPVNQSLVAVPIIILYEIGISLSWLARRKIPASGTISS
jgi:sec-independent protein translocase protein TatC